MQTEALCHGWLLLLPLGFMSYSYTGASSGGSCPTFVGRTDALLGGVCFTIYALLFSAALTLAAAGGAEPAVSCEHRTEQPGCSQAEEGTARLAAC